MAPSAPSTGAGTRRDVTLKLPQLQNLCKRDPDGYRDDYDAQIRRLRSECGILALSPASEPSPRLVELVQFAAAVSSSSYKGEESDGIADLLIDLLLGRSSESSSAKDAAGAVAGGGDPSAAMSVPSSALQLHRDVRKACVSALILMRNKGAIPPLRLLELFFRVMSAVPDKNLRESLHRHIVNDVRNVNKKGRRDERVNKSIQSFLHRVVSSPDLASASASDSEAAGDVAARRAVDMVAELYRRGVWTDERTVAIMASAVRSPNATVMARAIRFFLGIEEKMAVDRQREEEDDWAGANRIDLHLHSRKTKSRQRQIMKQVKNRRKKQVRRELDDRTQAEDGGVEHSKKLYPAIELLHDPQGLAESVFRKVRTAGSNSYKFEVKLLMVNFVTRLVGNHELLLLPLYPFLRRYMGGHQRDVTAILAYAVQACHQYVPPDEIHGILKTIAHEFITERCSGEQMAVGINAVRAICARVPSVLSAEEGDDGGGAGGGGGGGVAMDVEAFARDLALYSRHRDRSVSIAGRAWTNFLREVHPSLLAGRDRGREGTALHRAGERPLRYGERRVEAGVAGAELLVEYEAQKAEAKKRKRRGGDEGEESDGSDDETDDGIKEEKWNDEEAESDEESGEWINCEEDEADGEVKDGDDDEEAGADLDDDDVAPNLVLVQEVDGKMLPQDGTADDASDSGDAQDVSKMSPKEREALRQKVSSTRVFTASDFEKMRKLVEREERAKRDPRAAARRKRAIAKGKQFEELSDDDSDVDSDDEGLQIKGVVNPGDIMAEAKRKRMNKAERLEMILAGRQKFEAKGRDGGSTNEEKKRKKNFLMSKFSRGTKSKMGGKETFRNIARNKNKKKAQFGREAKKRRRKM